MLTHWSYCSPAVSHRFERAGVLTDDKWKDVDSCGACAVDQTPQNKQPPPRWQWVYQDAQYLHNHEQLIRHLATESVIQWWRHDTELTSELLTLCVWGIQHLPVDPFTNNNADFDVLFGRQSQNMLFKDDAMTLMWRHNNETSQYCSTVVHVHLVKCDKMCTYMCAQHIIIYLHRLNWKLNFKGWKL